MKCPQCDATLEVTAEAMAEHRLELVITQEPGTMLSAGALASVVGNLEKALKAEGRELGQAVTVLIESVQTAGNDLTVSVVVARTGQGKRK